MQTEEHRMELLEKLKHVEAQSALKRRRKKRFWIFVLVNLAGVIIAYPLFSAALPLFRVWWNTRSQESVKRQIIATGSPSRSAPAASLTQLTNQLTALDGISDDAIQSIITEQFGLKKTNHSDPSKFDDDSAVFHRIRRFIATHEGQEYFCYEIDFADENGNHKTQVDCFEKPDLDYERSMATLELVRNNPQLKKIYDAFAHVLAEQSQAAPESDAPPPVLRLEKPQ